ncbi:MAG: serine/threonine protein kinase [Myxococcaceae bacterium]|nr:serine/threonine protein kinase [Myxococcaceae bacterium]
MVGAVSPVGSGPALRPLPSRDATEVLPRVFGRYVLFDRIGRGGMADIFLARADTALGGSRLVVVKQILPALGHDPQFEQLLIEEAKLAAQLTHGNVVQVFDLGREDDRLFIVMEYVEGYDLNQLLRAVSRAKLGLPAEFALLIIRETLRALDYAHRLKDAEGRIVGLVHRDVSPSNVLISFEGEVKLCDFGIARAFAAEGEAIGAPAVVPAQARIEGKSAYMSPEHARGEDIDARADVFAAGILLWELCAGRRMYRGSEKDMLAQARRGSVPRLPDRKLPAHDQLQAVLDRALAKNREDRFASAQEFLSALEDYAVEVKLMASQLRFASFLADNFGSEMVELRRERELSVRELQSELPTLPPVLGSTRPALGEERERKWREPGMSTQPPPSSAATPLGPLGPKSVSPLLPATLPNDLSEQDLERSLSGLDLLAQEQADAEHARRRASEAPPRPSVSPVSPVPPHRLSLPPARISSLPVAPPPESDWVWYAVAIVILLLGVVGYFVT